MNKKIIYNILVILSLFIIVGCNLKKVEKKENNEMINVKQNDINNNSSEVIDSLKIFINNQEYTIYLENNETVKSFIKLLPQEFHMNELNGNEKYVYLDDKLPTNESNPKNINTGDVMLYGNNCHVIFYKSFNTNYSYTKIGHIDNLPNLGNDDIKVKIEK